MVIASSPPLPAANVELRRLFAAGAPPDGNQIPLMRALVAAELVVPMHPRGGLLRMGRQHVHRAGIEEVYVHAFTGHELAERWAQNLRDVPPVIAVVPSIGLCKQALDQGVDAIDIDTGAAGFSLRFHGMMNLLSRSAFDGRGTVLFERVGVVYGMPKTMPPQAMLDELQALGRAHRLTRLAWCMAWIGDAPAEMQLVYTPYPNALFGMAVVERMNDLTRDRFTMCTHDALENGLPADRLQRLI